MVASGHGKHASTRKGSKWQKKIDYNAAKGIIDAAYKSGVNYYDTAFIYHNGESEEFVGKALAAYPRNSYYIADKFNFQAEPDYEKQFHEQLKRLNMDHIDFYLLHDIQDNFVDQILTCGCIPYFQKLKETGKIHYFGFSFHGSVENLERMLAAGSWDFVQIQLNYYDWEYGNQKRLYEILSERQIPVMVMEPVHGGLLARLNEEAKELLQKAEPDRSLASWAMRWVKSLDGVQVVLSGMSTVDQVNDNVKTFSDSQEMSIEEKQLVKKAAVLLHKSVALPCTGCHYCTPNCPMQLDIPTLLVSYNEFKTDSAWRLVNLTALPKDKQPSACIACGSCTAHCPQSLPVPMAMKEMAEQLSKMQ